MKIRGIEFGNAPRVAGVVTGGLKTASIKRAVSSKADLLELRIDAFADLDPEKLASDLRALRKAAPKLPLLLTVRSEKEGGVAKLSDAQRLLLYRELMPFVDAVDVEIFSRAISKDVVRFAGKLKKTVVLSFHDFRATPSNRRLDRIVQAGFEAGADIVKIAARANDLQDLRRLALILSGNKDMIVIAMGASGGASRVFFPALGSLITYASITRATAPGQMKVKELKREFLRFGLVE